MVAISWLCMKVTCPRTFLTSATPEDRLQKVASSHSCAPFALSSVSLSWDWSTNHITSSASSSFHSSSSSSSSTDLIIAWIRFHHTQQYYSKGVAKIKWLNYTALVLVVLSLLGFVIVGSFQVTWLPHPFLSSSSPPLFLLLLLLLTFYLPPPLPSG